MKSDTSVNRYFTLWSCNLPAFDREFAKMMVKSHQEAVSLFETASANTGVLDGDLRGMAAAKLPKLKAHLQEAITLSAAVNP